MRGAHTLSYSTGLRRPSPDIPTYTDAFFGVSLTTAALVRTVEMAQYEELSSQHCTKAKGARSAPLLRRGGQGRLLRPCA